MKRIQVINYPLLIMLCTFLVSQLPANDLALLAKDDQCVACHLENEIFPDNFSSNDIHLQKGLSCVGCHGGDAQEADMERAKAQKQFIGKPAKKDIPQFCGKCHSDINIMRQYQPRIETDQVGQYYTSIHGQKLKKGDNKVADCLSCHTAHSILAASDPRSTVYPLNVPATCNNCHGKPEYMKEYGLATNQMIEYKSSVHGKALLENLDTGAPACNDCHGNHGAMPPGVSSISHVCGSCHINNMQNFSTTKMARSFEKQKIHACEECHGNHAVHKTGDAMVGVGQQSTCVKCHSSGDAGYRAAADIFVHLKNSTAAYDSAAMKLKEVQKIGMDDVEILFLLQKAHQDIIQARTIVHSFDPDKVGEKTSAAISKSREAKQLAGQEIVNYSFRRKGLGVATVFITLLAVALFLKIRDVERADK